MTSSIDVCDSCAMLPIVANAKIPTNKLVNALTQDTATVSCRMLLWYLLYEAKDIIEPNAIPIELKVCVAAFTHTLESPRSFQFGLKKYCMPF